MGTLILEKLRAQELEGEDVVDTPFGLFPSAYASLFGWRLDEHTMGYYDLVSYGLP